MAASGTSTGFFGYIEGYYGRVLTWEQRRTVIERCSASGLNTYLYAPKDDPYHRIDWRRAYPASWKKELAALAAFGRKRGVTLIPAIAPGLSYDYLSVNDYAALRRKIAAFTAMGITTVALLMDDIPETLPASCTNGFSSLGEAHGRLAARLEKEIARTTPAFKLLFCPTVYSNEMTKVPLESSDYLADLAQTIPENMHLFWTGPRIVAESLDTAGLAFVKKLFGNRLIIWDNYYANDYCTYRLFVGPYARRSRSLRESFSGVLLNPSGLFHTDLFLLDLFAHWKKTGTSTLAVWKKIARKHGVSKEFDPLLKFFDNPYRIPSAKDVPLSLCKSAPDLFNNLVVKWQHPLKLEWYPWLHALTNDLNLLREPFRSNELWQRKRYPASLYLSIRNLLQNE